MQLQCCCSYELFILNAVHKTVYDLLLLSSTKYKQKWSVHISFNYNFSVLFPFTTTPTSFCLVIISSCQFVANKLFSCSSLNMDAETVTNKEVYSIHAFTSFYFFSSYKCKFKPSCPIYIISLVCLQIDTLI